MTVETGPTAAPETVAPPVVGDTYGGHLVMGVLVGAQPILGVRKTNGQYFVTFSFNAAGEFDWKPWPLTE